MKLVLDTHSHTIASGHFTTDTVTDLARGAQKRGLELICITVLMNIACRNQYEMNCLSRFKLFDKSCPFILNVFIVFRLYC